MKSDPWDENRSANTMPESEHSNLAVTTPRSSRWRLGLPAAILISAAIVPFWAFNYEPLAATAPVAIQPEVTGQPKSETRDAAIPLAPSISQTNEHTHQVGRGDTLAEIIAGAGLSASDAHRMVSKLKKLYPPRELRPGHEFSFIFAAGKKPSAESFRKLTIRPTIDQEIILRPGDAGGYQVQSLRIPLMVQTRRANGTIQSSLYDAAVDAGMPPPVLMDLVRIFSWDVDFQREIWSGDSFEAMFERITTEQGKFVRHGRLLYAQLKLRGVAHPLYLHKTKDGLVDYFDPKGKSAKKALMRTPINGARLSSRYGLRRHPVLGYNKMHRGLDFAAPSGTPIYAAGNGTLVYRARKGAYGNYVKIRHNSEFSTAYGHLKRFARNVRRGTRVKQGQIIGYVGTTGRSTGPHLHYEVLRKGKQVNPRRVKMPSGRRLAGSELQRYQAQREAYATWFAALPNAADLKKQTAAIQ